MNVDEKIKLIKQDALELIGEQELIEILKQRTAKSYWGIAPSGPPHIGYYRTIAKQFDLIKAGFDHTILIANLHAYMDDMKSPWEEINNRAEIYKKCLQLIGLEGKNVTYKFGTDFQLDQEYYKQLLRMMPYVTVKRAARAASEVCRNMENAKVSSIVYPLMQSLDCWALDIDLAYAGIDNRHVYMLTREIFPKLGFKKPSVLLTPLGLGLEGAKKMDASKKQGRLELFASEEEIRQKIMKAYCPQKQIEGNPVFEYMKYLIMKKEEKIVIKRPEKYGGDLIINSPEELEQKYLNGEIHPLDLKNATAEYLIKILKPIREYFEKNPDLLKTFERA